MTGAMDRPYMHGLAFLMLALGAPEGAAQEPPAAPPGPGLSRLYVAPMSHCDVGFTHTPADVAERRGKGVEEAIAASESDPDRRWTLEVGWDLDLFLARHGPEDPWRRRLRAAVAAGRISIGALYVNAHAAFLTGAPGILTAHLDDTEAVTGARPRTAILADVPRAPAALADALAAAGVRRLLWGPNDTFSAPAPLPRNRPFWWKGPGGGRVLTYILDGGYFNAADCWLVDAQGARFFKVADAVRLGEDAAATAFGIARESAAVPAPFDTALASHSFDNWSPDNARRLLAQARAWNAAGRKPEIVVATPDAYFDDVERRFAKAVETVSADMGAAWETVRAQIPVTTARYREALGSAAAAGPERRRALALAADHNMACGPVWPGSFERDGAVRHNREVAEMLGRAVHGIPAPPAVPDRAPPWPGDAGEPAGNPLATVASVPEAFAAVIADTDAGSLARPVAARMGLVPDLGPGAAIEGAESRALAEGRSLWLLARFDRCGPGITAVMKAAGDAAVDAGFLVPLQAALAEIHWDGLPASERLLIAPGGAVLHAGALRLRLSSPLVFAWAFGEDPRRPGRALLSALVVRHGTATTDKGGKPLLLTFAELFPGEPAVVATFVRLDVE